VSANQSAAFDNRSRQQHIHHKDQKFMVRADRRYFPDLAGEKGAPTVLKSGDQASGKCCMHEARSSQMLEKSVSREDTGHDSAQSSAQRTSDPTFFE